jgi:hypothetical protein
MPEIVHVIGAVELLGGLLIVLKISLGGYLL